MENDWDLREHLLRFVTGTEMASDEEIVRAIQDIEDIIGTGYYDGKLDSFLEYAVSWMRGMRAGK